MEAVLSFFPALRSCSMNNVISLTNAHFRNSKIKQWPVLNDLWHCAVTSLTVVMSLTLTFENQQIVECLLCVRCCKGASFCLVFCFLGSFFLGVKCFHWVFHSSWGDKMQRQKRKAEQWEISHWGQEVQFSRKTVNSVLDLMSLTLQQKIEWKWVRTRRILAGGEDWVYSEDCGIRSRTVWRG